MLTRFWQSWLSTLWCLLWSRYSQSWLSTFRLKFSVNQFFQSWLSTIWNCYFNEADVLLLLVTDFILAFRTQHFLIFFLWPNIFPNKANFCILNILFAIFLVVLMSGLILSIFLQFALFYDHNVLNILLITLPLSLVSSFVITHGHHSHPHRRTDHTKRLSK